MRLIHKMGRHAVDSNMVFFEDMEVPEEDRIGEEGEGFRTLLHGLNPERVLVAAEAIGIGRAALAARHPLCARARRVRPADRPEPGDPASAGEMLGRAGGGQPDGDEGRLALRPRAAPCGAEANAAKYLAGEAGFRACEQAVMTHGGMGYAQEYHVERYLRESLIPRIAPVSPQLILSYLAERVLDLPKSVLTQVT